MECFIHRFFHVNSQDVTKCLKCTAPAQISVHSEKWRWIPANTILNLPEDKRLVDILRDVSPVPCASEECDGTLQKTTKLLNDPAVFCICIGWENDEATKNDIVNFSTRIPSSINLKDLFDICPETVDLVLYLG